MCGKSERSASLIHSELITVHAHSDTDTLKACLFFTVPASLSAGKTEILFFSPFHLSAGMHQHGGGHREGYCSRAWINVCRCILYLFLLLSLEVSIVNSDESDTFAFFHEGAKGCLGVRDQMLYLSSSCKGKAQLWKWVTRGRLFNIGSSLCLGITTGNMSTSGNKSPLGVFRCDYEPPRVRWTWSCSKFLETLESSLPSPKLLLDTGSVSATASPPARSPSQKSLWRVYDDNQDLCAKSYR
ncbi:hypothetical protein cypCar_00045342, partial [Cyprinus carpio]